MPSSYSCCNRVASALKSSTISQPRPWREQQQPSSKLRQSFSFIPAYSPSPPHAVLSAAPNSSICPAGPWQEAAAVFLQPNFDWPTSSSHSRVLYFFPFLACTRLHSSKGTYAAMEIVLEVTQALLLFVPQFTPTERAGRTRRGEQKLVVVWPLDRLHVSRTVGQKTRQKHKLIHTRTRAHTHTHSETNTALCFS